MKKQITVLMLIAVLLMTMIPGAYAEGDSPRFNPGTYTASAVGRNANVVLECVFTEDALESITCVESQETAGVGDLAIEMLSRSIVESQSLGVDSVSGASLSSFAVKQAVADCVAQAGGDVEAFRNAPFDEGNPESIEETYDVVIIGSGAAGMSAGIAASERAASAATRRWRTTTTITGRAAY